MSDRVAKLMASTFYALLPLADLSAGAEKPAAERNDKIEVEKVEQEPEESDVERAASGRHAKRSPTNLHYNIQIHLPATKDIEVFNAIFKSLKEHLID